MPAFVRTVTVCRAVHRALAVRRSSFPGRDPSCLTSSSLSATVSVSPSSTRFCRFPTSWASSGSRSIGSSNEGLKEVLEEVSPIEDFTEQFQLYFGKHQFKDVKSTEEECRDKDITFSQPAVRRGHLRQQGDRRDQGAGSLHGGLPDDDRSGHLHHQRHRAGRRLPARALARRLLLPRARQDHRQGRLHREDHPQPRRLARVRRRQEGHGRRPHRPQAPPARHGAAEGARLDRRRDPRAVRQRASPSRTPWRRTTSRRRKRPSRTSTASCARASRPRPRARRRCSRTCSSTPSATTWPRSAATRSTRSSAPAEGDAAQAAARAPQGARASSTTPTRRPGSSSSTASSPSS